MIVVVIAFTMFVLSLLSPVILTALGADPFIAALGPLVGLVITGLICIPGTARLIVRVVGKGDEVIE